MSVFRSIVFSAVLAGAITGAAITGAQMVGTIPLIQKSEVYERKAEAPAPAPTAAAQPAQTHDHGAAASPAHSHEAEWEPAEGLQRNAFTTGANILTAIGFALLLAGIFALRGRVVSWREGLFWGLGGFVVFTAAPGLGLPPELPGMPVADLTLRQTWWIGTACATAAGLGLLVFRKASWAAILGLGLIVLPHLIGAPLAPAGHTDVPEALSHSFVVAAVLTSLLFWALLGVLTSIAFRRISRT
ncbi:cobalt transporter subunit CbtA [Bradyrhizobium sp. NFR13]|uniref:CbtA family protein n=1 Tax=Bradyrhizobium sp. NFR13 TaxID=1566285 RepID=UPI0008E0B389|nr:CbtA family protein [Bradyrhizobium sp. NFR13]SFL52413.1 cobalt transporter subunit CbtA [Bradyrhizobium sp. NFR13]